MAEYVDRDEYIKSVRDSFVELSKIYKNLDNEQEKEICEAQLITFVECILRIKDMPVADVTPVKHGKWCQCFEDWRKQIEGDKCSCCGFEHYGLSIMHYRYCPSCGAKMDLEGMK